MSAIPSKTMIVVADGRGARVFRNVGEGTSLQLHQVDELELMNANDDGPARSMPGESSASQIDEATFAKQLAHGLNAGALKQQYQHLILIADPSTLGRVRPLLHKETQQRLLSEIAKDLTNATLDDIQHSVSKSLAA
ncbi:MAG: host attachment family protein [Pseudoxanthomonas sp.]